MDQPEQPGITPTVLLAGLLTLAVTAVRLIGELQQWSPTLFSREAGGPFAVVGITWLVPVFGFVFGRRLARAGHAPRALVRTLLLALLLMAAFVGGTAWIGAQYEGAELLDATRWIGIGAPVLVLCALLLWPRGAMANLAYGVLARAPVIVVQYVSIAQQWGTHYEKVDPHLPPMEAGERAQALLLAQTMFWIPFTVLVGMPFAVLGALTFRRSSAAVAEPAAP
jgi:hypothetical protein